MREPNDAQDERGSVAIAVSSAFRVFVPSVLVCGLAWLLVIIHRRVYDGMLLENPYQVKTATLNVSFDPSWAVAAADDPAPVPFPFPGEVMPLRTPDLPKRLAAFYEASPWVDHVEKVEVRLPNQVKVRLVVREPVVAVKWGETHYLVDKKGVRLPGQYEDLAKVPYVLFRVSGVQASLPRPGQRWADAGIPAGVAVAAALRDGGVEQELGIDAIDVANVDGRLDPNRSEIVLHTGERTAIEWGRSPWTKKFGEPTMDSKLENLRLALEAAPGLRGVKYLKLQFDRPYMAYR